MCLASIKHGPGAKVAPPKKALVPTLKARMDGTPLTLVAAFKKNPTPHQPAVQDGIEYETFDFDKSFLLIPAGGIISLPRIKTIRKGLADLEDNEVASCASTIALDRVMRRLTIPRAALRLVESSEESIDNMDALEYDDDVYLETPKPRRIITTTFSTPSTPRVQRELVECTQSQFPFPEALFMPIC
jgi:hypothetical protein